MTINTSSGVKYYIGTTAAATDAATFAADTYTEIKEVEDGSEFGDNANLVTFSALGDGRVRKLKGARDAGTLNLVCGRDHLDAGQIAVRAAELTKFNYNIKVQLADAADANDTNSVFYFKGMVMSQRAMVGTNDNVVKDQFTIAINSALVSVPGTVVP